MPVTPPIPIDTPPAAAVGGLGQLPERLPCFDFDDPSLAALVALLDSEADGEAVAAASAFPVGSATTAVAALDPHACGCLKAVTGWLLVRVRLGLMAETAAVTEADEAVSAALGVPEGPGGNFELNYNFVFEGGVPGGACTATKLLDNRNRLRVRFRVLAGVEGDAVALYSVVHVLVACEVDLVLAAIKRALVHTDNENSATDLEIAANKCYEISHLSAQLNHHQHAKAHDAWLSIRAALVGENEETTPDLCARGNLTACIPALAFLFGLATPTTELFDTAIRACTPTQRAAVAECVQAAGALRVFRMDNGTATTKSIDKIDRQLLCWRQQFTRLR